MMPMLAWRWQYVAEYIEREALLREMLNSGRAAYLVVMDAPAVNLKSLRPTWRDPDKDPPKVETEVLVLVDCGKGYCITTAFYEDGTVSQYESVWQWEDVDDYGIYDEEEDLYRLAKGWWEYRHFTPEDALECPIDKPVVGWMPLPPKEVTQNGNQ
jgi:hypothetical protein